MVTRKRLRSILTTLGLYVMAALLIGYFGVNAYSGNHGLKAKVDGLCTELSQILGQQPFVPPPRSSQSQSPGGQQQHRDRDRAKRPHFGARPGFGGNRRPQALKLTSLSPK